MFWLFLLGIATFLTIALRRVLRKQKPLNDELYSKSVAVEHVHSGVAWVRGDGRFEFVNQAFAKAFDLAQDDFRDRVWYEVFGREDRERLRTAYDKALLMGITNVETDSTRADGSHLRLNIRLVVVHDHKMRVVGFHCLVEDRTRARTLEDRIRDLERRNHELEETVIEQTTRESKQSGSSRSATPHPISILIAQRRAARLAQTNNAPVLIRRDA